MAAFSAQKVCLHKFSDTQQSCDIHRAALKPRATHGYGALGVW